MPSPSADLEARATWREWAGLAVLALPTLLVSLDIFVMLLALPQLSTQLGAGGSQQLWIMDVYGFMVAGLMITMGKIGDRIGRRKLLLSGAVLFAVASVTAAHASTGTGTVADPGATEIRAARPVRPSRLWAGPRQRTGRRASRTCTSWRWRCRT